MRVIAELDITLLVKFNVHQILRLAELDLEQFLLSRRHFLLDRIQRIKRKIGETVAALSEHRVKLGSARTLCRILIHDLSHHLVVVRLLSSDAVREHDVVLAHGLISLGNRVRIKMQVCLTEAKVKRALVTGHLLDLVQVARELQELWLAFLHGNHLFVLSLDLHRVLVATTTRSEYLVDVVSDQCMLLSVDEDVFVFRETHGHVHRRNGLDRLLVEDGVLELVKSIPIGLDYLVVAELLQPAAEELLRDTVLAVNERLSLLHLLVLLRLGLLELLRRQLLLNLRETNLVGFLAV